MGKWVHRLKDINEEELLAFCIGCNRIVKIRKRIRNGRRAFACYIPHLNYNNLRRNHRYRKFLKDKCERCGFIPEHRKQMDIHHKDKNHSNNEESNLQTLCANCHRLFK